MNVKVHTPKSLASGSGMATMKQFLMSMVATTISIVLTFGTASWVEGRKKAAEKREMVMMILYDIDTSINSAEKTDSTLRKVLEQQIAVAEKPEILEQNRFLLVQYPVEFQYTETVEKIFASNIETINTIGNMLFAENVSNIYLLRKKYKEEIFEAYTKDFKNQEGFNSYEKLMEAEITMYIFMSSQLLQSMKELFQQCKTMMNVSDDDLNAYMQKRAKLSESSVTDSINNALVKELMENHQRLIDAKSKDKK